MSFLLIERTVMRFQFISDIFQRMPIERRQRLRRMIYPVRFGTLLRTRPISQTWGFDRGLPVDRYYIEMFLQEHRRDIRGRVMEVRDSSYIDRFGQGVERSEILDINPDNPRATFIADLAKADSVPEEIINCFILTQVLQLIFDIKACLSHVHRILQPGGVLLATVPCVSRIAPRYGLETDYWRFTPASCRKLFGDVFGSENVTIHSYGNVLAGIAFLEGIAAEELRPSELDSHDPYFPVLLAIRAVKKKPADDELIQRQIT